MSLEDVTDQSIQVTKVMLDDLQRRATPAKLVKCSVLEMQNLTGLISKLQRGLASVLKEARALAKDAQDAAANMTQEQLDEVITESFLMRTPAQQTAFLATLRKAAKRR